MADPHSASDNQAVTDALTWRPLRILCVYRLLLACLLLGGFMVGTRADLFSPTQPRLFLGIAGAYVPFAVAMLLAARHRRGFLQQVIAQGIVDVLAIGALVHASGGLQAGLGVLMLVAVAGNSLLAGVRFGTFFAALATLTLLADQFLLGLAGAPGGGQYTEAGLLGIATFVTAIGGAFLARWARENEALARRRGIDIADLEALNAHIVQRMETGVIAIDTENHVRLTNAAARGLLQPFEAASRPQVGDIAPALASAFEQWQETWESTESPITDASGQAEYLPRFQPIGHHGENGTLVFLDNLTQMRAHVQQAKLASLGRLTASIAHEVRNPLGAMLQASQLLGEAKYLEPGDKRLLEIIQKQGRRMNKTVENVMLLSRRAPPERERIAVNEWLARIAEEWREQQLTTLRGATLETELAPVEALFDQDHLRQIVENLMRNAAEHAGGDTPPTIRLSCSVLDSERGVLEVADNGRGIAAAIRDHLFEPFATGSRTGTGLGLYLARELCEANQARIRAENAPGGGAQFAVIFMQPPQRQIPT